MTDQQIRQRNQKFYQSKEWRSLRNYKIQANPLCEHCLLNGINTPATEIDHIISITLNWLLRLDWENLQSLCRSCHSRKTMQENRHKMNPKPVDPMEQKLKDLLK